MCSLGTTLAPNYIFDWWLRAASIPRPVREDSIRLALVYASGQSDTDQCRRQSLECSMDLEFIYRRTSDSRTCLTAILDSCWRRSYLHSAPKRIITPSPFNCALEMFLLTYLLNYLFISMFCFPSNEVPLQFVVSLSRVHLQLCYSIRRKDPESRNSTWPMIFTPSLGGKHPLLTAVHLPEFKPPAWRSRRLWLLNFLPPMA